MVSIIYLTGPFLGPKTKMQTRILGCLGHKKHSNPIIPSQSKV